MHKHMSYSTSALLVGGSVFIGGVVIGMVVGAVSGLLFAPRSGEDTRELLHEQADELSEAIKDKGLDIFEAGKRQVNSVLQRGREVVENVR